MFLLLKLFFRKGCLLMKRPRFPAPEEINGKKLVEEEILISNEPFDSKESAERELNLIRLAHRLNKNFVEIDFYVEQLLNKQWRAVYHRARYE